MKRQSCSRVGCSAGPYAHTTTDYSTTYESDGRRFHACNAGQPFDSTLLAFVKHIGGDAERQYGRGACTVSEEIHMAYIYAITPEANAIVRLDYFDEVSAKWGISVDALVRWSEQAREAAR